MEIQEKKAKYGENWREVEQQKLQQTIEEEIGGDLTPHIYDSRDLYDFFEPINFYKDEDNQPLKMDFNKFSEVEKKYSEQLNNVNKELASANGKEKAGKKNESSYSDGESEIDESLPLEKDDFDDKGNVVNASKRDTPSARAKGKLNQIASTYFHRFVPLYNKHVCTCCGEPKRLDEYYPVYNITCSDRVDEKGTYHMWICKDCVQKLFIYYYNAVAGKNVELAMQYTCASLNLYWDSDYFYQAKTDFEDKGRTGSLIGGYIKYLNNNAVGMTFMDSPFLDDEHYNAVTRVVEQRPGEAPFDWTAEEAQYKKDTVRIVGWDPFEDIKDENSKKTLYQDFCSLIDEELAQDWIKCQSAITIVKSFLKVRQLDKKLMDLEETGGSLNEQKAVSDLKKKELDSITTFSQNNGWSERFKSKVSKGETSFSGIMKTMNDKRYENALVNKFDIATGATMQQAMDYSVTAIMKQLSFSDAEVWKITQEQYQELLKLRKENSKLEEELRKARYSLAEEKLKAKALTEDKGEE